MLMVVSPTFGPAMVTLFGVDVPIIGFGLSMLGLVLARMIAPPPLRKLSRRQEWALTILLIILLFLIVTGELFGTGRPLHSGLAVIWGVGLGFSGLLAIEMFGERVIGMIKAAIGKDEGGRGGRL